MLDGIIDVSHHNGTNLDFTAAASTGIIAVIQKASQGQNVMDPTLMANRAAIGAAALRFGAYHFGDGSDGGAQAQYFLSVLRPRPGDLLVLDLESNPAGPSMTLEEARAFVAAIKSSAGVWPVLYSGHDLKDMLANNADPLLSNCPLWLAQYGPAAVLPPGWNHWSLWQYTDGAVPQPSSVTGIGHCDRNMYNGDINGLADFWAASSIQ